MLIRFGLRIGEQMDVNSFKSRQFRNLMVTVLLITLVALPLAGQPLGLVPAWEDIQPTQKQDVTQGTSQSEIDAADETPTETYFEGAIFNDSDFLINRGNNLVAGEIEADFEPGTDANVIDPGLLASELTVPYEWEMAAGDAEDESSFVEADYLLYIAANTLNFRVGPSTDSASLGSFGFCDEVQCIGEGDKWVRIVADGQAGYVYKEYTSKTFPFKAVSQTVYVSASTLNLRTEPTTESEIILELGRDDKLTRTGVGIGWSEVKTSSGKVGYVASRYITTQTPISILYPNRPTYSGDIGKVVDLAYSAIGVRYVWGGASMSGMDCSGLVQWVYKQVGIYLPHQSGSIAKYGQSVSYGNMKAGDVICFDLKSDGRTAITHVGIYVGNGYMIDASTSNRQVVRRSVSRFLSYYSGDRIVTIRRLIS